MELLEHLAPPEAKIEKLTNLLAQRFGGEAAMSAARNFAGEIINDMSEPVEAQRRKKINEQVIDIAAEKREVPARITLKREIELQRGIETPHEIENTPTAEPGLRR